MDFPRTSGLLLHPTSLPGRSGIGDLGDTAYRWVDFLAATGQTLWQVLPLGFTGYAYDNSPYESLSALAGNPLLDQPGAPGGTGAAGSVSPGASPRVSAGDGRLLPGDRMEDGAAPSLLRAIPGERRPDQREAFQAFTEANAAWLDDFALFMALKQAHDGKPWNTWKATIRNREPTAMMHGQRA